MQRPTLLPFMRQRQRPSNRHTLVLYVVLVAFVMFHACTVQFFSAGVQREEALPATVLQPFSIVKPRMEPEIWARPLRVEPYSALLDALGQNVGLLEAQCGRSLYRTLTHYTKVYQMGHMSVVLTGDIPAMWIRDSAVQLATYLPRIKRRPALRCAGAA